MRDFADAIRQRGKDREPVRNRFVTGNFNRTGDRTGRTNGLFCHAGILACVVIPQQGRPRRDDPSDHHGPPTSRPPPTAQPTTRCNPEGDRALEPRGQARLAGLATQAALAASQEQEATIRLPASVSCLLALV